MEWWAPGTRRELCPDALSGVELFIVSGRLRPQARASLYPHLFRCQLSNTRSRLFLYSLYPHRKPTSRSELTLMQLVLLSLA